MSPGIVFVYHGITDEHDSAAAEHDKYWLTRTLFREHLHRIVERQRVSTLEEFCSGGINEARSVVFTFDDGNDSDYRLAGPLLMEFGIKATFFVNTSTVGTAGFISWPQVRRLHQQGMSIGSHGHEHVYLTRVGPAGLRRQLNESKMVLEDRLGCNIDAFSAPYGDLNRKVLRAVDEAGYRVVCNSRNRPATPGSRFVNRIAVYDTTSARTAGSLASANPLYLAARYVRSAVIFLPKRLLFNRYR